MTNKNQKKTNKEQKIVHIPSPRISCLHEWQLVKEWYEDLYPGSTADYQTHKVMLVCRKCGEVMVKEIL